MLCCTCLRLQDLLRAFQYTEQQGSRLLQVGHVLDLYLQFAKDNNRLNQRHHCLPITVGDTTGRVGQIFTRKAVGEGDAEWTAKLAELMAANPDFLKDDDDYELQPCDVICMGTCQRHGNGQEAKVGFNGNPGASEPPLHEFGVFTGKDKTGKECHAPLCMHCLQNCFESGALSKIP